MRYSKYRHVTSQDLLLLLLFVLVGTLVFSSLVYYAEHEAQSDVFTSIPRCFWWAIVTMTTVGYGDMAPVTVWGCLVGPATAISGVLMIGFTVPVLVNNFVMYYQYTQSCKYRKQRQAETDAKSRLATLEDCEDLTGLKAQTDCLLGTTGDQSRQVTPQGQALHSNHFVSMEGPCERSHPARSEADIPVLGTSPTDFSDANTEEMSGFSLS